MKHYTVGFTGASGAAYGLRLLEILNSHDFLVDVVMTDAARDVLLQELSLDFSGSMEAQQKLLNHCTGSFGNLHLYGIRNWSAPIASRSVRREAMVVVPCSMGTLSAISQGASDNLLERAADVMLKEGRKLILVPRECPYSTLHLKNMLAASEMGIRILPASPAFYQQPKSISDLIDFVVGRILDQLDIPNELSRRWSHA